MRSDTRGWCAVSGVVAQRFLLQIFSDDTWALLHMRSEGGALCPEWWHQRFLLSIFSDTSC